jgi:hypothetical protein
MKFQSTDTYFSAQLGSLSLMAHNDLSFKLEIVAEALNKLTPNIFSSKFSSLRESNPSEHKQILDSVVSIALVALDLKPFAIIHNIFSAQKSQIQEDLQLTVAALELPYRKGSEFLHVINPSNIYDTIHAHQELAFLRSLSPEESLRTVLGMSDRSKTFHTTLGLLYGYPAIAVEQFAVSALKKDLEPTRNLLEKVLESDIARQTYDYLSSDQYPINERTNQLAEILLHSGLNSIERDSALERFKYENNQRVFGVGSFVWIDSKESAASIKKHNQITSTLDQIQIPYYQANGPVGSFLYQDIKKLERSYKTIA